LIARRAQPVNHKKLGLSKEAAEKVTVANAKKEVFI
jgi:hypothetical protein